MSSTRNTLVLSPLGVLSVIAPPVTTKFMGPFGERATNHFVDQVWKSDLFTLRSPYAMARYLRGPRIAEVQNRLLFVDDSDGTLLTLEYIVRLDMPTHVSGETPAMLTGVVEVDDGHSKYSFLNRTQVVGKSFLRLEEGVYYQEYDMCCLE